MLIRDAFRLDQADPLVAAFQGCYRAISGRALADRPQAVRGRRQQLLGAGQGARRSPTARARAGSTPSTEWVEIDDLVRVASLYAATALAYCCPAD